MKVSWPKLISIVAILALIGVIVAQNTQLVQVKLLFATLQMPLTLTILSVFGAGFVLGAIIFWKRGRRHQAKKAEKAARV